jgi:pyridoxamine 5'-phosphate oxidase
MDGKWLDQDRSSYEFGILRLEDLAADPILEIKHWIDFAIEKGIHEPTATNLATATTDGKPSNRMVLIRSVDPRGVVFFTNYLSRKGHEIEANPQAAMCCWWPGLERQLRIEGILERVSREESDAYFAARPRESQIASAASDQSQPLETALFLQSKMKDLEGLELIERPDHWGGYRLLPNQIEFWQGRKARLHDRFEYRLIEGRWSVRQLQP